MCGASRTPKCFRFEPNLGVNEEGRRGSGRGEEGRGRGKGGEGRRRGRGGEGEGEGVW